MDNKKYCVFSIVYGGEESFYKNAEIENSADLIRSYARSNNLMEFIDQTNSQRISTAEFAQIEQTQNEYLFSADFNVDNNEFILWQKAEDNSLFCTSKALDSLVSEYKKNEKRLFVDMDGTLAEFKPVDVLEKLYEPGYFTNLEPNQNIISAVKEIINNHPDVNVYVLSAVLSDSQYALEEKNQWLNKYLPEVHMNNRIFVPCGEDKKNYVPGGIKNTDCLIDDYSKNLREWQPPAIGIKCLNGINGTKGTWKDNCVSVARNVSQTVSEVLDVIENSNKKSKVFDDVSKWQDKAEQYIKSYNVQEKTRKDIER